MEVGKDYKRIVFFLCKEEEFNCYEVLGQSPVTENCETLTFDCNDDLDDFNEDNECHMMCQESIVVEENCPRKDEEAQLIASTLAEDTHAGCNHSQIQSTFIAETTGKSFSHISCYRDVVKELNSKVNYENQFFITTRRKMPFPRILSLWKRQSLKCGPTDVLRVHYSGEDGIDYGALALEFLEECIGEMGKKLFPDGAPIDSSFHAQSGNFRTCGHIVAASLAQGGPPPCFLEQSSYEAAFIDVDMTNIAKEHLAAKEVELINKVRSDCPAYIDLILEHGYTGPVSNEHVEAIIRSLEVSFVSRRALYMKEFMIGLESYGLNEIVKCKPDHCQPLFVNGDLKTRLSPDADYLFALMVPRFSRNGTSRRCTEENVFDFLQDTLIAIEDKAVTGQQAVAAWNYDEEKTEGEAEVSNGEVEEVYETPCVNIPGVMAWLTGMKHKPINEEKPAITVTFDHECQTRNPKHSICFPVVSACGKTLTFPVVHMNTSEKFREIFTLAYCKGQSFAKP